MCQSREEAASLGMTPSNFIEAKAPEDSKRAGEKPEACPSFSLLPMASGAFKKTGEGLSSWGRPLQSLGACKQAPEREVPLWGLEGQVPRAPHSTLPGFMRPRGSSVALSRRMVSTPTAPTSSSSSCRLPSPMPCSPVHVPWSASARLGGNRKGPSAGAPPAPAPPLSPPSCPASRFALTCPAALQRPGP